MATQTYQSKEIGGWLFFLPLLTNKSRGFFLLVLPLFLLFLTTPPADVDHLYVLLQPPERPGRHAQEYWSSAADQATPLWGRGRGLGSGCSWAQIASRRYVLKYTSLSLICFAVVHFKTWFVLKELAAPTVEQSSPQTLPTQPEGSGD